MALSEIYITLAFFKSMIQVTDTQDDVLYQQYVDDANQKVSDALFRYVDLPLDDQSDFFRSGKDAALSFARHKHTINIELIEKAKAYHEFYNVELYGEGGTEGDPMAGGLIQRIIGTRTNRTKTVLVGQDVRDKKVILPTQTDLAPTEEFI